MTGWNLPPGCEVSDLPGNGAAFCDYCGEELGVDDDGTQCDTCGDFLCENCISGHHCEEDMEDDDVESE